MSKWPRSLLHPVPGEYNYEVVGCGYSWMSLALKALSSARKLMQNTWISMSSIQLILSIILAKISGSLAGSGRFISQSCRGVAKQLPMFSLQHGAWQNKVTSSSAAPQSLQDGSPLDCPFFSISNLEALDSSPWQPRRRPILKFDFDVRWIQSGQLVTFQCWEGEKFRAHMDNCSRSLFVSAWFNRCICARVSRMLVAHFFQQLLDGVFWRRIAMFGKCSHN